MRPKDVCVSLTTSGLGTRPSTVRRSRSAGLSPTLDAAVPVRIGEG